MVKYNPPDGCATATVDTTADVAADVSAGTTITAHIEAINLLLPKLKQITGELEEEIGGHIIAIKAAEPIRWEAIVKARCGLSRSRAYELIAIADGTKSTEQTRRETNARKIKHRQNQTVRSGTDGKKSAAAAAANAQIIELQAAHARQIERFRAEIAQLGDAEALRAECNEFRTALDKISRLLGEVRGLTGHFAQNRVDIIAKVNRALTVVNSALQPAKAKTCNPADSSVKRAA
jgi:hypothetical protein